MRTYAKRTFPVDNVRRFLEPGPVVLISTAWRGKVNIMTLGWHMVVEFQPSLVACCISSANHTFEMARRSGECVINLPTVDLARQVVGIGNTTGAAVDKFSEFRLTAETSTKVAAPSIKECYACFECRLADAASVRRYNLFVWEVVHARVAASPKYPRTLHYRGDGIFMVSGEHLNLRRWFRRGML